MRYKGNCTRRSVISNIFINQLDSIPAISQELHPSICKNHLWEVSCGFEPSNSTGNCISVTTDSGSLCLVSYYWPSTIMIALMFLSLTYLPLGYLYGLWHTLHGTWMPYCCCSFSTLVNLLLLHVNQSGGSPGCCCIHLSWHCIPHLCGNCHLSHLHTNQIKTQTVSSWNGKCHEKRQDNPSNLEHQCGVTPNIVTHIEVNLRELRSSLDLHGWHQVAN